MLLIKIRTVVMLVCVFSINYSFADSVDLGNVSVSKEDVIRLLEPQDELAPINTRGIRLHGDESRSVKVPESRALSMEVLFEFNSADLTQKARDQLAPVGEALRSNELEGLQFTLEGHTDAVGGSAYNMKLSQRRALSVKGFFVEEFQVSDARIRAIGKGESELLNLNNPDGPENRRVKIIAE